MDTASGCKLSEVPLAWDGPLPATVERVYITSLPDDARFLAGTFLPTTNELQYTVFGVADGAKVGGPFRTRYWIGTFSADGNWCATAQDDFSAIGIVNVKTATSVFNLTKQGEIFPHSSAFSPTGNQVAIHWRKIWRPNDDHRGHFIVIYELPSGREIRRFDLPARPWQRINSWESDQRLYAQIHEPDPTGPGCYFRRSFSFSMGSTDIGAERPEPLRAGYLAGTGPQTYWEAGDGWIAHLTTFQGSDRSVFEKATEFIDRIFRTSLTPDLRSTVRIRMLDAATGDERCVVPLAKMNGAFSQDGHWIASAGDAVEVWSVPPPRQNLWATCAGLATLGTVLAVGQRGSRPTHD